MLRSLTRPASAAGVLMVVLFGATVAFATIPDADGTIHGCYTKSTGGLRVIDGGEGCKTNEVEISWGEQGPPGPEGPQGPQGLTGERGEPGHPLASLDELDGIPCLEDQGTVELTYAPNGDVSLRCVVPPAPPPDCGPSPTGPNATYTCGDDGEWEMTCDAGFVPATGDPNDGCVPA